MATYTIVAVHVGGFPAPYAHEHIESVRLSNGNILPRGQVIAKLRAGDTFNTVGSPAGHVYEHNCPHCGTGDYITTHPDSTPTNNLLHLLRY